GETVVSKPCDEGGGEIVVSKLCGADCGETVVSKFCDGTAAPGCVGVRAISGSPMAPIMDVVIRCDSPLLVNRIVSGSLTRAFSYSRASSSAVLGRAF